MEICDIQKRLPPLLPRNIRVRVECTRFENFAKVVQKCRGVKMLKLSRLNCFWPLLRKTNFAAYINKVMITDPQLNDSAIDNLCVFDFGDYEIN